MRLENQNRADRRGKGQEGSRKLNKEVRGDRMEGIWDEVSKKIEKGGRGRERFGVNVIFVEERLLGLALVSPFLVLKYKSRQVIGIG